MATDFGSNYKPLGSKIAEILFTNMFFVQARPRSMVSESRCYWLDANLYSAHLFCKM